MTAGRPPSRPPAAAVARCRSFAELVTPMPPTRRSHRTPAPPRRPNPGRAGRAGFTLAEVLIALGILLLGMVMVMGLFPTAITLHRDGANDSDGMTAAANVLAVYQADPGAIPPAAPPPAAVALFDPRPDAQLPSADVHEAFGYRLATRPLADGNVEVAVFAYAATDPQPPPLRQVEVEVSGETVEGNVDPKDPASAVRLPVNRYVLAQSVTTGESFVARATGERTLLPAPVRSDVYRLSYPEGVGAVAVVTGVVRTRPAGGGGPP